jgi:cell division cycle 20-like protein 1, cofactor of APC complex
MLNRRLRDLVNGPSIRSETSSNAIGGLIGNGGAGTIGNGFAAGAGNPSLNPGGNGMPTTATGIVAPATAGTTTATMATVTATTTPTTTTATSASNSSANNNELNKDITMYRAVLRNELLGASIDGIKDNYLMSNHHGGHNGNAPTVGNSSLSTGSGLATAITSANSPYSLMTRSSSSSILQPREMTSVFQYGSSLPFRPVDENSLSSPSGAIRKSASAYSSSSFYLTQHSPYSLSPLSASSQKLLRSPRKPMRKIPKVPFKVLDAPELQDDFYLNLVDWSSTNVLGVGLGTCVYLWSACTSQVTRLCDLANREDSVSSVSWSEKGNYIAVGTFKGDVQIWDAAVSKLVNTLSGHTARVGALAWNHDLLCSGSRDRNVLLRDIRAPNNDQGSDRKLCGHKQEVCGLKWSPDHLLLASGGNDNKLLVWNVNGGNTPIQTYNDHIAAVKAIAWSPHQHGLLASGGGTADRCIRFWNTLTGQNLQYVDTGSQVCNLAWSKHSNELVSTHGYSQNQILIWKYPSMAQLAKLTGHTLRVLYLAVSPDGEAIVTGAGDETLRFWNVFNKSRCTKVYKTCLKLYSYKRYRL